jgi:hypothetical protein
MNIILKVPMDVCEIFDRGFLHLLILFWSMNLALEISTFFVRLQLLLMYIHTTF